MCEAIANLVRDTFSAKAMYGTLNEVRDIGVLCLEMTVVDTTAPDGPLRLAEVVFETATEIWMS